MNPVEFVLWLNGAAEIVGDQPPTPEQWATMREKLGEAVGGLVAARLLERAEETLRADERRKKSEEATEQMFEAMKVWRATSVPLYPADMEAYRAKIDSEIQKLHDAAATVSMGTFPEAPEIPKPHSPGLLNRILGEATP